mgnify:CR=1 FL=1
MEKKKKESEKRLKRNRAQKETQENKDPNTALCGYAAS